VSWFTQLSAQADQHGGTSEGGFVMIRRESRRHGASHGKRAENRPADDWLVYIALLPAIVASAAIAITSAIALGTASSWHSAIPAAGDLKATPATDNYVEGLAKLGIAKLPTYEPAGVLHSGSRGDALPMTQLARGCVLLG
jgi:hypothetical protein